jgi:two-component system nitrate/nitrite response regulator NarL
MNARRADIGTRCRSQPSGRTSLFILAEICFYREGLARFFSALSRVEVVGTAADARVAVELARRLWVDVILIDIGMPASVDASRMLATVAPEAGIVALGVREDEREVISLAEAGVSGFVARDASLEELARAVESAAKSETRCSPRVAAMLARRVSVLAREVVCAPAKIPLTRRQLEIVELIGEGLPNKAIARQLFIELPTVKNHVHNILERLGVDRREDAVSAVRALSVGAPPP